MTKPTPRSRSARHKPASKGFSLRRLMFAALTAVLFATVLAGVGLFAFYIKLDSSLPSARALKEYQPPIVSSVYASDGTLIGEFFIERRYVIPSEQMPPHMVKAFMAAEDVRFYDHGGVDFLGIVRATIRNIQAGEIVQGGSTITQQVVKSLLLTPERTYERKLKEAILAYRIDKTLSKDEILYLYLNQIYFGAGAYGIEAAARTYFDKHASELNMAEVTLLAGLPKAPSRFSPLQNFKAARDRQRYVLQQMTNAGFISEEEAKRIYAQPLQLAKPKRWTLEDMNHFTEEVRRQVQARYGRDMLYKEGLKIYTTLDLNAQKAAQKAIDQGLRELDKRHTKYRGVHANIPKEEWPQARKALARDNGGLEAGKIVTGLVQSFSEKTGLCTVDLGEIQAQLPKSGWEWTGASMKRASRLFRPGDVIRVRLQKQEKDSLWTVSLEQDPGAEGALMAMDPSTGRVICMVGGRDFQKSQFNRATQAARQPGSAFKPIVYAAALDKGYTEASILIDSPLILSGGARGAWAPENYDRQFWGPIPLRKALIHSRNVVTVKLLSSIGVKYTIDYAKRLGINSQMSPTLALALGASDVTLQEILTAYSAFANGGNRVQPYLIEKILDRNGKVLENHQPKPERVISAQTAYLMTHLLSGVVEEGTGTRAKAINRPAAGKTGTTNEMKDAWFVGYTPELLAGVWVGYDDHHVSLGKGETGGRAACPIWVSFMQEALKERPVRTFPIPPGIVLARVNPHTGAVAGPDDASGEYAAFAGSPPAHPGHSPGYTNEETIEDTPPPRRSSSSESFFKSDLF